MENRKHEALKTVIAAAMALAYEHKRLAKEIPPPSNKHHINMHNEIATAVNDLTPSTDFYLPNKETTK